MTRTYQLVNGKNTKTGKNTVKNFGNVGIFGNYSYGALNSDMGVNYFTGCRCHDFLENSRPDEVRRRRHSTQPSLISSTLATTILAITLYYSNRDPAAVVFTDYSFSTVSAPIFDSRMVASMVPWFLPAMLWAV